MELIVAVFDDWGIGRDGTQQIALMADRKFFRETTRGAMVIAGRKTIGDFPGKKPLPGRLNVALTRGKDDLPGFTVCHSPEEAVALAKTVERAMVIGGGSVYRQMLPYCDTAYITKVHATPIHISPIWMRTKAGMLPKPCSPERKTASAMRCCSINVNNEKRLTDMNIRQAFCVLFIFRSR